VIDEKLAELATDPLRADRQEGHRPADGGSVRPAHSGEPTRSDPPLIN
jgi:hypothetical protein